MNTKVIVTGNKEYGLAKAIASTFPDADFYSRANGFDFWKKEYRDKFAELSLEYEVCILCAYIPKFTQLLLLETVWEKWNDSKHRGQIIVLGSTADYSPKRWMYPIEKRALKDFCRLYGKEASGGGPKFWPGNGIRVTYVAPGMLDLPKQREKNGPHLAMLDTKYLANVIMWLTQQPENVNIYDISMDPVQYEVSKPE